MIAVEFGEAERVVEPPRREIVGLDLQPGVPGAAQPCPFQRLALLRLGRAPEAATDVERHQEVKILVGMAGECQRREAGNFCLEANFLEHFPDDRFLGRFALLHLAARKFPQAGQRLAFRALRKQHAAVGVDQRHGRNQEELPDAGVQAQASGRRR